MRQYIALDRPTLEFKKTTRWLAGIIIAISSSITLAAECGNAIGVFRPTAYNGAPCFGTYSSGQQSFVSGTPIFALNGGYTGTGSISSGAPNGVQAFSNSFGSLSSFETMSGSSRGYILQSSSASDLAASRLRVFSSGAPLSTQGVTQFAPPTGSSAYLRDQISVLFPKTFDSVAMTLILDVNGSFTAGGQAGLYSQSVTALITPLDQYGNSFSTTQQTWISSTSSVSERIQTTFLVPKQTDMGANWGASFGLWAVLSESMPNGGTTDFAHSAYAYVTAGSGVIITSDSGVTYSAPVPEVNSFLLCLVGLPLLSIANRKRSKRPSIRDLEFDKP